ncbi:MAG: amino acid permease [Steroidobacteraceae bacterium]
MKPESSPRHRLFIRKPVEQVQREVTAHALKRTLGPLSLITIGIGCTIGAGIYVLTGAAAANFAGPAVLLSFVLAGFACAFAGLCYAELASTLPVAGSAYTYSYTTLGEVFAWITGWLMVLELGIAAALVAVGFSGYVTSLLQDFGIDVPAVVSTAFVEASAGANGLVFAAGQQFNLIAAAGILAVTVPLALGISESAAVNSVLVIVKLTVLLAFVAVGVWWVEPANWTPFVPPNEGGFTYGWPGIFRAAAVIFFAYVGFETVATTAAEAKNPQRDLPIGILGTLGLCTLIYIAVAAVLTGVVSFKQLGVPDPLAVAVNVMDLPGFGLFIKVGAILGLGSVMLMSLYGQTRVFYTMSRDGLLPPLFSTVHPRFSTPFAGTIVLGAIIALVAAFLPITLLADLVSLGVAIAFAVVSLSVMWLRTTRPQLTRPFRVPFGGMWIGRIWIGVVPVLGILFSLLMVLPLILDITGKALAGNPIPAILLSGYIGVGAAIYAFYGLRHSKLAKAASTVELQHQEASPLVAHSSINPVDRP